MVRKATSGPRRHTPPQQEIDLVFYIINTDMQDKNISRHHDLATTGHGCTRIVGVKATQNEVFANGIQKPMLRIGDPCLPHVIRVGLKCKKHRAFVNDGSRSVFVKNIPVGRIGDSTDFGALITGSFNVFAGD
jgi:uncharacterized Zn-binding protein involved in type VI secretion